jgi:hypothetical protein
MVDAAMEHPITHMFSHNTNKVNAQSIPRVPLIIHAIRLPINVDSRKCMASISENTKLQHEQCDMHNNVLEHIWAAARGVVEAPAVDLQRAL